LCIIIFGDVDAVKHKVAGVKRIDKIEPVFKPVKGEVVDGEVEDAKNA